MSKPDLFVRWHLGLGDAIICNGLVRALVATGNYETVSLCAKAHNLPSVRAMFSDLPLVSVLLGDDVEQEKRDWSYRVSQQPVLRLGMFAEGFDRQRWAQSFYEQAGVPYEDRWARFKVGDWGEQREPQGPHELPWVALHEGGSQGGAIIDRNRVSLLPVEHVVPVGTLWQWGDVLRQALEVHAVDSSVACLVDHLPENGQRLVLHKYARNSVPPDYRRKWEILE